ncbi:hypothetical protein BGZ94_007240 [Podila epigama]|nr:hypothetical protein BGZ94_007240 [Podila epigama]
MGKKQFIDRKNARHFHLVHRSQRDPLSRDENAPQRVLKEVIPANLIGKVPQPREEYDDDYSDGEADIFGGHGDVDGINYGTYDREIESVELLEAPSKTSKKNKAADESKIGQAALLGLVDEEFNDGSYDYTQHFKEMGKSSDGVFVPAPKVLAQQKKAAQQGRGIQFTDADAAEEMLGEETKKPSKKSLRLPSGVLPSREELDFEDVYQGAAPVGLNPDMPFDLRQTLEALEDDEFVDDDLDESFFDQLDAEGDFEDEEVEEYYEDEDDEDGAGGWQADFRKFKKAQQYHSDDDDSYQGSDDGGASQYSRASSRRAGGASASTFSMSSSAMFRNENLTLLDERFDKIEREYESDSDEDEERTDLASEELRKDFDSILDDFLDKFEIVGSKMVPRLEGATSENKLTTIRNAMLVDDDEKSVATTVGGTKSRKKKDEDIPEEIQTDFRSRAERMRDNWDVQTILSTYSNLENHPGMIKETRKMIHIDPKTGMPVVTEQLSKKALQRRKKLEEAAAAAEADSDNDGEEEEEEEEEEAEPENLGAKRNKAETKEEKKARKEAIKQEKKNRRETKKATKVAFASEKSRQEKVMKNVKKDHGVMHLD